MPESERSAHPLPDDPALAEVAAALRDAGHWVEIVDPKWRLLYASRDLLLAQGFMIEPVAAPPGADYFGTEMLQAREQGVMGEMIVETSSELLNVYGDLVLRDFGGDREALRRHVDPRLHHIVDHLDVAPDSLATTRIHHGIGVGGSRPELDLTVLRIRGETGSLAGTALIMKPHIGMSLLATLAAQGDPLHFARMQSVSAARRRPAAVLFADLEGSTSLGRRLSTAKYFNLGRRLTRAADQAVVDAGGITGRHAGDGVVGFFVAENFGSESAAAAACIRAARSLATTLEDVARRSELDPADLTMRFGLHWGSTLHIGLISTVGRTEVTALGDEVNECARIEACATGGRTLASKMLVERLSDADAAELGLDIDHVDYVELGELTTATDKARRDARSIAVCEVGGKELR